MPVPPPSRHGRRRRGASQRPPRGRCRLPAHDREQRHLAREAVEVHWPPRRVVRAASVRAVAALSTSGVNSLSARHHREAAPANRRCDAARCAGRHCHRCAAGSSPAPVATKGTRRDTRRHGMLVRHDPNRVLTDGHSRPSHCGHKRPGQSSLSASQATLLLEHQIREQAASARREKREPARSARSMSELERKGTPLDAISHEPAGEAGRQKDVSATVAERSPQERLR